MDKPEQHPEYETYITGSVAAVSQELLEYVLKYIGQSKDVRLYYRHHGSGAAVGISVWPKEE